MTEWLQGWKSNGWRNSSGETVINMRDFQRLERKMEGLDVKWVSILLSKIFLGNC